MIRSIAMAAAITTMGTLPVFLLSAQAVLVQEEVGISNLQVGLAASTFFATAALASVPAGYVVERVGRRFSAAGAGLLATSSLLGVSIFPSPYPLLMVFIAMGGVANALGQVAANVLLTQAVPRARQGLAFGTKQSAVPVSSLLGGLAVPMIGVTVGWRWAFAGGAALALTVAILSLLPGEDRGGERRAAGRPRALAPASWALVVVAVGTGLASAATNALAAYLVVWSVQVGFEPSSAGFLLAAASAGSVIARVALGMAADRHEWKVLPVVAAQLAVGSLSFVLLSGGRQASVAIGALIAFWIGWAWPGLLVLAVVRSSPASPGISTSIMQMGAFVGGAAGPAIFGLLAAAHSFAFAWRSGAASLAFAAALLFIGGRGLTESPGKSRDVPPGHPSSSCAAPLPEESPRPPGPSSES